MSPVLQPQLVDIERWIPSLWNQFVGNQNLKEYWYDLIHGVRCEGHTSGYNMIGIGDSRSGKTSITTFGIKALGCNNLDLSTFNPCGHCWNCRTNVGMYGNDGWSNWMDLAGDTPEARRSLRFLFLPVDCTRLTEQDIDELLGKVRIDDGTVKIVYLDEVHRLARRRMDEQLLKPLETCKAIWIASSAYVRVSDGEVDGDGRSRSSLEKMFQNRFTFRIETQKPRPDELVVWLAERCQEWGIRVDSPEATLSRLAEKSSCVPGMALQVLNKAHKKRSKLLTSSIVDQHVFDFDG